MERTYAEPRTVEEAVGLLAELEFEVGIGPRHRHVIAARKRQEGFPKALVALHRISRA